jgi:hypothetical protein
MVVPMLRGHLLPTSLVHLGYCFCRSPDFFLLCKQIQRILEPGLPGLVVSDLHNLAVYKKSSQFTLVPAASSSVSQVCFSQQAVTEYQLTEAVL